LKVLCLDGIFVVVYVHDSLKLPFTKEVILHNQYRLTQISVPLLLLLAIMLMHAVTTKTIAQENVGIGTSTPDSSAVLELSIDELSSPKGVLLPRLTTVQRDAIILPAPTLLIYNVTLGRFEYNIGSAELPVWTPLQAGNSPITNAWALTGNLGIDADQNFIGTNDGQDLVFKTNSTERFRISSNGNVLLKSGATAGEMQFYTPASNGNFYTSFKAGNQNTNITYTLPLLQGISGSVLKNDGNGLLRWSPADSGSVTSIGVAMPSIFNVSNSPITSNGTIGISLIDQDRNTFFAGPLNSAGTPSFRRIDSSDIPQIGVEKLSGTLPVSKGGTGVTSITGIITGNGTNEFTGRTITGTASQVQVTNGGGATADPTIALADNPILPGSGSVTIPLGTTAERPAGTNGMMRYNSTSNRFEYFENGQWVNMLSSNNAGLTGSGTENRVAKFDGPTSISNSNIFDNGTTVSINTTTPEAKAALQINSTTQGFMPPRMTSAQREDINPPASANGLIVYQTDSSSVNHPAGAYVWTGSSWGRLQVIVTTASQATMKVVSKSQQQQITGTTTPVNDTALILPMEAGEKWVVDALLLIQVSGSSLGNVNFRFSLPTGATLEGGYHINAGSNVTSFAAGGLTGSTQYNFTIINNTVTHVLIAKFVVTAGNTAGSLVFACAPTNSSNVVTVRPGSYFISARGSQ